MTHTKGKVEIINRVIDDKTKIDVVVAERNICSVFCIYGEDSEALPNANLIAECFSVTNETGKTPRELQVENEKLRNNANWFAETASVSGWNYDPTNLRWHHEDFNLKTTDELFNFLASTQTNKG